MYYTLKVETNGDVSGPHFYVEKPAELPTDEIECTEAQAQSASMWAVVNGSVVAKPPTSAQQAIAALAAGLTISSTSTPAINGTYATDDAEQARLNRVYSMIERAGGVFPSGLTSMPWPLADGTVVEFPSVSVFLNVEQAIGEYVLALDLIRTTNSGTLPSASVTIA